MCIDKLKDDMLILVIIAGVTMLAVIMLIFYANAPVYPAESIKSNVNYNIMNPFLTIIHLTPPME
jgi:hypothetical protein